MGDFQSREVDETVQEERCDENEENPKEICHKARAILRVARPDLKLICGKRAYSSDWW